jgi:phosphonatase-like hydrolase
MRHLRVPVGANGGMRSPMTDVALVVFDLVGTTIRDGQHVASAFVAALAEQDVHVSEGDLARVRGASKRQAIAQLIPDGPERTQRAQAAYQAFRSHLADAYLTNGVHAIEGAEALFRFLRSRSVRVALNTGLEGDIARLIAGALNWEVDVVDTMVCADDVSQGRPAPFLIFRAMEQTNVQSVHRVMNVGDTDVDLHAGYNAGWNVGVLTGAHDRETLSRAPHTHLIESIAELPMALGLKGR